MLALLFFAAFILILTAVYLGSRPQLHPVGCPPGERTGLRRSAMMSAVIMGTLIVLSTEAASLFGGLSDGPLAVFWAAVCAGAGVLTYSSVSRRDGLRRAGMRWDFTGLSYFEAALVFFILAILSAELVTALTAAPNNFDSMTYHLSRVEHWIQGRSVAHYPTNISRQLYLSPFAEFAILHLRLLSGSDRFAGLVQWSAGVGSIVGASLIAGRFMGGDASGRVDGETRGALIAAVFVATLPMGVLQSSSTKNDYVTAFWLVSFVYFMLDSMEGAGAKSTAAAGASAGLAILTKVTAVSLVFPFALWYAVSGIRKRRAGFLKDVLIMAALVVAINAGHAWRNTSLYGHPMSPPSFRKVMGYSGYSMPLVVSAVVKNAALQLGTPVPGANAFIEWAVRRMHTLVDVDINDARTTAIGHGFDFIVPLSLHESRAGNPLHFILAGVCLCGVFFTGRRGRAAPRSWYASALMAGALILCINVKWTPVNGRYYLPHFVLLAPLVGVVLSEAARAGLPARRFINAIAIILIAACLPWVFFNAGRPLLGPASVFKVNRIDQYFVNNPRVRIPYKGAAGFLTWTGCADIGLLLHGDWDTEWWEYPLWVLLKEGNPAVRIESVGVTDASGELSQAPPFKNFAPCAIISFKAVDGNTMTLDGKTFIRAWSQDPVDVYIKLRTNP
jgi:hypothetical protein